MILSFTRLPLIEAKWSILQESIHIYMRPHTKKACERNCTFFVLTFMIFPNEIQRYHPIYWKTIDIDGGNFASSEDVLCYSRRNYILALNPFEKILNEKLCCYKTSQKCLSQNCSLSLKLGHLIPKPVARNSIQVCLCAIVKKYMFGLLLTHLIS